MDQPDRLPKEHPAYQARLEAQHRMVLALGLLPAGGLAGLLLARPLAERVEGIPLALMPTGILSVLLGIGIGLLLLALVQGGAGLLRGFWNLRHALHELSGEQRLVWYTLLLALLFLGLGTGCALGFLFV